MDDKAIAWWFCRDMCTGMENMSEKTVRYRPLYRKLAPTGGKKHLVSKDE